MSKEETKSLDGASLTPPLVPKKRKKKWIFILIFLVVVGGIVFFFRQPILNGLSKVPFIGDFIPLEETSGEQNLSMDELKIKVSSQEQELERLQQQIELLEQNNSALTTKNESLKQYETMYTDFVNQKAKWDEEVASKNPDLFIEQFESIYPETAERIYQLLKGKEIINAEQKKLSATVAQMDEGQAAAVLELLISTDPELVQSILDEMGTDRKALILSEMSEEGAAQAIKLISPDA